MAEEIKLTDPSIQELVNISPGDKLYVVDVSDLTDGPQGTSKFIKHQNVAPVQNNYVRVLEIPSSSLSGEGTEEEQICEYILDLPAVERTILETDSKWNIIIIDTPTPGVFAAEFGIEFE